jgi:hypothetical protein
MTSPSTARAAPIGAMKLTVNTANETRWFKGALLTTISARAGKSLDLIRPKKEVGVPNVLHEHGGRRLSCVVRLVSE